MIQSPKLRVNPGKPAPSDDQLLPGILVHFGSRASFLPATTLFYPALLSVTTKHQMMYPGDRPGYSQGTGFIVADYSHAAEDALQDSLQAKGTPKIEVVTLKLARVEKNLNWLDETSWSGSESTVHAEDVPERVRAAARR